MKRTGRLRCLDGIFPYIGQVVIRITFGDRMTASTKLLLSNPHCKVSSGAGVRCFLEAKIIVNSIREIPFYPSERYDGFCLSMLVFTCLSIAPDPFNPGLTRDQKPHRSLFLRS